MDDLIPKQEKGNKSDNYYSIVCENLTVARQMYINACNKLMNINEWGNTANNVLLTDFSLFNKEGEEESRSPKTGDFIRINLAGPGSKSGDGFDWVQIEDMIQEEENDMELTSIKVRPATSPINESTDIAHFFDESATSTFIILRKNNQISAEIHGRNEKPNTTTNHLADNVRNNLVAKFAAFKFSDIQWKNLCIGFLS